MRKKAFYFLLFIMLTLTTFISIIEGKDDTIYINNNNEIIYHGDLNSKKIYLTFDDGYSLANTQRILDTLKEKNVSVTFFLEGAFLDIHSQTINRIVQEGHLVGCHTWSHNDITQMSNDKLQKEILRFENRYYELTRQNLVKVFRPPMGFINNAKLNLLTSMGYTVFKWNVDYPDYNRNKDYGINYAYNQIVSQVSNGSIILMHTLLDSNALALGRIIDELKSRGYIFSSLHDFL